MIAALILTLAQGPVALDEVRLEGPLMGARWEGDLGGMIQLELDLGPGESVLWRVPRGSGEGAWEPIGGGRVRVQGPAEAAPPGPALPVPLGRPSALVPARGLGWGAWMAVAAGALGVFGLRRRPVLTLSVAGIAAGAVAWFVLSSRPVSGRIRVLDGRLDEPSWTLTDGARSALPVELLGEPAVWIEPPSKPSWRIVEGDSGEPAAELRVSGAACWAQQGFSPGMRVLSPQLNGWGDMEAAWLLEPGRGLAWCGRWGQGDPLGTPSGQDAAAPVPPSWLREGLPAGARAVLARLAPGAFGGPNPPQEVWLRLRLD